MMREGPERVAAEARRRGLLLIWAAQLGSLALIFALAFVIRTGPGAAGGNHTVAWALGAVGVMSFLLSFLVKRKLLAEAAAKGRFDLATTAYVLACALCELTALLGFVAYLVTGLSYALHSFALAAAGMLLHFPARGAFDAVGSAGGGGADFKSTL
jgi:hypothetical protein